MFVSGLKEEDLTVDVVDKILFQGVVTSDKCADCAIVLGSNKAAKYRLPVAVDAYKAKRINKIMVCGGTIRDFSDGKYSEAYSMYRAALELGVPTGDIIIEDLSQNTVENIQYALEKLEQVFGLYSIRSVLLVTTAYHIRRSIAICRKIFPNHIAVIPCPANDNNTKRDNWMNTPEGVKRAKGEAMNIVRYITSGVIPDFEI